MAKTFSQNIPLLPSNLELSDFISMNPCDSDYPCYFVGFFSPSTTGCHNKFPQLKRMLYNMPLFTSGPTFFAVLSLYWASCFFLPFICHSKLCHLYCIFSQLHLSNLFSFCFLLYLKILHVCFKKQGNLVSSVTYMFHCCKHPCWGCCSSQILVLLRNAT